VQCVVLFDQLYLGMRGECAISMQALHCQTVEFVCLRVLSLLQYLWLDAYLQRACHLTNGLACVGYCRQIWRERAADTCLHTLPPLLLPSACALHAHQCGCWSWHGSRQSTPPRRCHRQGSSQNISQSKLQPLSSWLATSHAVM